MQRSPTEEINPIYPCTSLARLSHAQPVVCSQGRIYTRVQNPSGCAYPVPTDRVYAIEHKKISKLLRWIEKMHIHTNDM